MEARTVAWVVVLSGAVLAGSPCASGQTTLRASVTWNGGESNDNCTDVCVSADGGTIAFESRASNLVLNDTNWTTDVFVHETATGSTERVSVDSFGAEGNGYSGGASISADGRFVAFSSLATNLVANDTNGTSDVFVHDRVTGATELVSVDSNGVIGNGLSFHPVISADGRMVAFASGATNLVANDTNGYGDVFVHDRVTGITECVSVDVFGVPGNGESDNPSISADGQLVAFNSRASNLVAGDTNDWMDVFVRDRALGTTERVDVDSLGAEADFGGEWPSISGDGMSVAFMSPATNLVANDTNGFSDVFVHSRSSGVTVRVSVDSLGAQGNGDSGVTGVGWGNPGAISSDGRTVAFLSSATNLVAGDTNGARDVFVHSLTGGWTHRASVDSSGEQANWDSLAPAMSGNGLFAVFSSGASNLVANDMNGVYDVFVRGPFAPASWSNFGAGFPGTHGVPTFTAESNPVLGSTLTLDLANSYGRFSFGLLFVGFQRTDIHSGWGGALLVVPALTLVVGLPPIGTSFTGDLPYDGSLCGFVIDLQAIESDPGATRGVSFTQGLELVLGN